MLRTYPHVFSRSSGFGRQCPPALLNVSSDDWHWNVLPALLLAKQRSSTPDVTTKEKQHECLYPFCTVRNARFQCILTAREKIIRNDSLLRFDLLYGRYSYFSDGDEGHLWVLGLLDHLASLVSSRCIGANCGGVLGDVDTGVDDDTDAGVG